VRTTAPRLTAASLAGTDVKLGEYRTRFNAGEWGRTRNIYVAAGAIDGKVIMPGQTFSFNQSTGRRTWEKGYRMAHIFERKPGQLKAEVVDGLAGGVCQVSSTLYNAVRKSKDKVGPGVRIVERNYHSLPVTYVPPGFDATVAWPNKDFRFRNTLPAPIYLRAEVVGSRLTNQCVGPRAG
jgi:vancomycin resistance protein YoaR